MPAIHIDVDAYPLTGIELIQSAAHAAGVRVAERDASRYDLITLFDPVAQTDPFHNGPRYSLRQARRLAAYYAIRRIMGAGGPGGRSLLHQPWLYDACFAAAEFRQGWLTVTARDITVSIDPPSEVPDSPWFLVLPIPSIR